MSKDVRPLDPQLHALLKRLSRYYPTRRLLADALGVAYPTVAHYFDGRSLPSFTITLRMIDLINKHEEHHGSFSS